MKTIAHRGAQQRFPENTLEAFHDAVRLGFDGVECDVRRCRSGELIIMHDARLERTTDGIGRVADTSYTDIKNLTIAGQYRVPTVQAVIEQIVPRTWVNFELKDADPSTIGQVADMLLPKYRSNTLISSKQMVTLSNQVPGLDLAVIHPIAALAIRRARRLKTKHIVTRSWRINRPWWRRVTASGEMNVYLYGVHSKPGSTMAEKGRAAGIICDFNI